VEGGLYYVNDPYGQHDLPRCPVCGAWAVGATLIGVYVDDFYHRTDHVAELREQVESERLAEGNILAEHPPAGAPEAEQSGISRN
jgi:hypothetical protein